MDRLLQEFKNRLEDKSSQDPAVDHNILFKKFTVRWITPCLICGIEDCRMVVTNCHEWCQNVVESNSVIYANCYYCSHTYYHASSQRSNTEENTFGLRHYYTVLENGKQEIWKKYHDLKSTENICPVCFNVDDEKMWKQDDNFICLNCDYFKTELVENSIMSESQRIEMERFNYWFPKAQKAL